MSDERPPSQPLSVAESWHRGQRAPAPSRGGRRHRGWRRRLRDGWDAWLELPLPWTAVFLLLVTWVSLPPGLLRTASPEAGDIARRDVLAPRALRVVDIGATTAAREQARRRVPASYLRDGRREARSLEALGSAFARARPLLTTEDAAAGDPDAAALLARLQRELGTGGPPPLGLRWLQEQSFSAATEDRLEAVLEEAFQRGVVEDKRALLSARDTGVLVRRAGEVAERLELDLYETLGLHQDSLEFLDLRLRGLVEGDADARNALARWLDRLLAPNLLPEPMRTQERQDLAAAAIEPIVRSVRAGEVVVRAGDRIDATQAALLAQLQADGAGSELLPILGHAGRVPLLAGLFWAGQPRQPARRTASRKRRRSRRYVEALLLTAGALVGLRLFWIAARALAASVDLAPFNSWPAYAAAVPFAAGALVGQLLLGRTAGFLIALCTAVAAGRIAGDGELWIFLYALGAGLAAVLIQERVRFRQRSTLVLVGLAIGLVQVLLLLIQAAAHPQPGLGAAELSFILAGGLTGGLLSAAVAGFVIPLFEGLLSTSTEFRLVELANTNLPLLQRLALEAPGTFQHSLTVAHLARAGCAAIGADATLAYTTALYHDIGKVQRPEYFIENQRSGPNPHDGLTPAMSSLVILSHVKDGLELAREHHLPGPVLAGIEQHHGTRRLRTFYDRARAQADPRAGRVREETFCYAGPRPQTREVAVLMLADCVEAACRSLSQTTPSRLRTVVRSITDACLEERQFDEADITLDELHRVGTAFLELLAHVHHRRLDEPGFDFEGPGTLAGSNRLRVLRP